MLCLKHKTPDRLIHGEHQSVPGDVTSLLLATRGEQA